MGQSSGNTILFWGAISAFMFFIHFISLSQLPPSYLPSLPPLLLKEAEPPSPRYYPTLVLLLVTTALGTSSPTEAQPGSLGCGKGIQWQQTETETVPAPLVRVPHEDQAASLLQMCKDSRSSSCILPGWWPRLFELYG